MRSSNYLTLSRTSTTTAIRYTVILVVLGLVMLTGAAVSAHDRREIGDYVVIAGWENEPVIVGERNSMIFQVTDDDEIVEGLEASLEVEVLYAGRIFRANLIPANADGWYSVNLIPTVRGQYTLRLVGNIESLAVDELMEPEEVLPPAVLTFPESPPTSFELQESIDGLSQQLQTTTIVAVVAIVLGLLGLLAAILGLLRRRTPVG